MGTNFYLSTNDREVCDKYFGYDYELTDTPKWAYQIHIAKTSCGWLPLFQSHKCFSSISELKKLYTTGKFKIWDEYGSVYNWEEFDKRVLQFNGGISGVQKKERIEGKTYYDRNLPEYRPISHCSDQDCTYNFGPYSNEYFKDEQGYEFTTHEFC